MVSHNIYPLERVEAVKTDTSILSADSFMKCDLCQSERIQENREGYICQNCGCVLEIQKLAYNRPYNPQIHQHAILSKTRIGARSERMRNPHSKRLRALNIYHGRASNPENTLTRAKEEINRILVALHCSKSLEAIILRNYRDLRAKISPRTKYRSPEKLVPIVIYYYHKLNNRPISEYALLDVAKISKKDFNDFKLQINEFLPHYKERNRQEYILQLISELIDHFGLTMEFYYHAKRVLYKLWETIKNTKDTVVAGLIASILILCDGDMDVSVSALCTKLGIRMSTIQFQVERRIMERLHVAGFQSLVRSSDLLRDVMGNLGVLAPRLQAVEPVEEDKILEFRLKGTTAVFNFHNTSDYYFYAVRLNDGFLLITPPKQLNEKRESNDTRKGRLASQHSPKTLSLWKYHSKGPPLCY